MWIDADAFVKGSFNELFDNLVHNEFVYWDRNKKKDKSIENSLLLAKKESKIIKMWYDEMVYILNNKKNIEWTEIGGSLIRNILESQLVKNVKVYNQDETCYPVNWKNADVFFSRGECDFLLKENQPVVMLYNHIFPEKFKNMNKQEFSEWLEVSDTILADLMKKFL
jgi:hypothetical protein